MKWLACEVEFILPFLLLYPVLVYHRYTNANIGLWRVERHLPYY